MKTPDAIPPGGDYVDSGKQLSLEKLTQSTHAHLLSFAVLFTLTGLTFAFTSYPGIVRGVLGPLVLIAQVADVSCWWLARLPNSGPYFAMCIIGTGGMVGMGLAAQIVLSLFDLYGIKGKLVLLLLFGMAGAGGGAVYLNVITPHLKDEENNSKKVASEPTKISTEAKQIAPTTAKQSVATGPSRLERIFTGPWKDAPWGIEKATGAVPDGGMVRAFFDKEADFKDALKDNDPELPRLTREREAEQAAFLAWIKSDSAVRKQSFASDRFELPMPISNPLTPAYFEGTKVLKIKSLVEGRCISCHGGENKVTLDGIDQLEKYLQK